MQCNLGINRLAGLTIGLGIGAAIAAGLPRTATADPLDFQINIDGMNLFPTTGNMATAVAGTNDIAIAYGVGSVATASGEHDFASTFGPDSNATTTADYDVAASNGEYASSFAGQGNYNFAYADGLAASTSVYGGSDNVAIGPFITQVDGSNNFAAAFFGTHDIASVSGNDDIATVLGSNSNAFDIGNNDLAAVFFGGGNLTASSVGDGVTTFEPTTLAGLFDPSSAATMVEPSWLSWLGL